MTCRRVRLTALVFVAALAVACSKPESDTDKRVAALEQQLAETQKQLADTTAAAAPPSSAPQATTPPPAAPPTAAPARKPAPAKSPAPAPVKNESAETQRLIEQQRAVNAKQAEANVQLQQQVEALKPREFTVPAGTTVAVRTTSELSTASLANGSTFDAILENDLKSGNTVVAKARSKVTGVVVSSDPGGRVKGLASLVVGLRSIVGVSGSVIPVTTDSFSTDAESTKKKDVARTGVATGIGAIIGGIAGGGSGAAKGAGIGAAGGVGVAMATRGAAAVIPGEALLEFHLASPVTVTMHQ